jgi:acid phosphatase type 7
METAPHRWRLICLRLCTCALMLAQVQCGSRSSHVSGPPGSLMGGRDGSAAPTPRDASTAEAFAADAATHVTSVTDAAAERSAPQTTVVIGSAGDISCDACGQGGTADILDLLVKTRGLSAVLPLGDNAYPSGLLSDFEAFYAPSWGRPELLAITHPVPGNHEYASGPATGYFDYFNGPGRSDGPAGRPNQGYYSYDLGGWHLVALNSSDGCQAVSCAEGSPQQSWLVADLKAHPSLCTLAYWHHPRFQAGTAGGETAAIAPLWNALYDAGADVVLNGHEHDYQQLAPLDKAGNSDPRTGMRTFVVGTGGAEADMGFGGLRVNAVETELTSTSGVLELTLRPDGYDWRFVTTGGDVPHGTEGSAACH